MEDKIKLRKHFLKQRKGMEKQEVKKLSKKIMKNLIKIPSFVQSKVVMIYLSFKNEVDSEAIIDWCFQQGKEVVISYCVTASKEIIPCKLHPDRKGLQKNEYGIWEPKKDLIISVEMENIDVIIIPGVSFDNNCNRLGFGGGYYDRFLGKRQKETPAIAICYENQIVESIPTELYDIPMDMVVTENNIFYRNDK